MALRKRKIIKYATEIIHIWFEGNDGELLIRVEDKVKEALPKEVPSQR